MNLCIVYPLASASVYNHYPSLRIVIENQHPLFRTSCNQAGLFSSQHTCNTVPSVSYKRPSYSFASTISTCCSAWAWDHDCHITIYCFKYTYSHEPVHSQLCIITCKWLELISKLVRVTSIFFYLKKTEELLHKECIKNRSSFTSYSRCVQIFLLHIAECSMVGFGMGLAKIGSHSKLGLQDEWDSNHTSLNTLLSALS